MKCLSLFVKIIVDFVVDDFCFIHSTLRVFFFVLFPLIVRSFMLDLCRFFIHFSVAADLFVYCLIHSFVCLIDSVLL